MNTKTILITGGHGFIGSHIIQYYLDKYPDYQIINIDYNTEAGCLETLSKQATRYAFHRVDIRNAYAINHLFELYDITDILHFAAETRSMDCVGEIRLYEQTNVLGTMNLLYAAQNAWMLDAHQPNPKYAASRLLHLSLTDAKQETLYSESKEKADRMIQRFHEQCGLNSVTTASPEIFSPMQQDDKLTAGYFHQALEGKLDSSEEMTHKLQVNDLCEAIDTVFRLGEAGERYEIGSNAHVGDKRLAWSTTSLLEDHFLGNNRENGQTNSVFSLESPH
ncbi:GDP-mannose 4,6-dehydratase [Planococcus faecalis]|uniref:dTDP-glucose 4,6-dehydratase n=1 Tax=Planococcus faecalis TaxID=1598147 RepID=A0ABM6IUJ9_9BACL|nr:GDP-mannose 4,6-dehydratase [Planococcus faecalis]AQU80235.1 dTDP-glucose 4,6-dehydratase [Planococcus faecalis]OHX51963.1 dTDP-glucose 4,6-dehydratase [Planococcus faecalis]